MLSDRTLVEASLTLLFTPRCSVVWCVLVLELVFEVIIRPANYFQLVDSEKAFAPSTARYINRFHLVFEAMALISYVGEFQCTVEGACSRGSFDLVSSAVDAVFGPSRGDAARGRFRMGLISLRFFGAVRHWKQMWINNTFQSAKREGIEKWLFPPEATSSMRIGPGLKPQRHLRGRNKILVCVTDSFVIDAIMVVC
jgi:hypothetical protein